MSLGLSKDVKILRNLESLRWVSQGATDRSGRREHLRALVSSAWTEPLIPYRILRPARWNLRDDSKKGRLRGHSFDLAARRVRDFGSDCRRFAHPIGGGFADTFIPAHSIVISYS